MEIPRCPTESLIENGCLNCHTLNRYRAVERQCPHFANDDVRAFEDWDPESGEYLS